MLVVRGLGNRTVVVVCESDEGGTLRVRDLLTDSLDLVVPAATPDPAPSSPLSAQRER